MRELIGMIINEEKTGLGIGGETLPDWRSAEAGLDGN